MAYALQPIPVTAATLTLNANQHGETVILASRAAGITFTLPDATGSGASFNIVVGTTITSNDLIVQAPDADNTMVGAAFVAADGGNTVLGFETAAGSDTITMNGSTTGGIAGDVIQLTDVAADTWGVRVTMSATGTEATPFSAAVS